MTKKKHWTKLSSSQLEKVIMQLRQRRSRTAPLFWFGIILSCFGILGHVAIADIIGFSMVLTDIINCIWCDWGIYEIQKLIIKRVEKHGRKK